MRKVVLLLAALALAAPLGPVWAYSGQLSERAPAAAEPNGKGAKKDKKDKKAKKEKKAKAGKKGKAKKNKKGKTAKGKKSDRKKGSKKANKKAKRQQQNSSGTAPAADSHAPDYMPADQGASFDVSPDLQDSLPPPNNGSLTD